MGFDVGSIVAKLQLDKTGWNQSISGVTKDQQTLTDAAKKIGQGFTDAGRSMAIAGAAITGTLGAMIYKTAEYGDHLVELSQKTGISVETLSGLKLAADKVGLSLDGLALGLKGMSVNMVEAATGAGDGAKLFRALGISVKDTSGNMRDTGSVLLDVADRFKGMEDGATKTNLAVKLFGRAGMELIPILNLGSAGLREQRDLAEKLGITFTKEGAEGAHEFSHSLIDLKSSAEGMGKQIAMTLIPAVNSLVQGVTSIIVKVREWAAAHPGLSQAMSTSALALGGMLTAMGSFIMIAGTLITRVLTLASALGTTAASLLGTISVWAAATMAVGYYVAKLLELDTAENYVIEADKRLQETQNGLTDKLSKASVAAGLHYGQMSKLIEAYNGNVAALALAIEKGKVAGLTDEENTRLKKALTEVGKEHGAQIDEERKKTGDLNASILALLAGGGNEFSDWLKKLIPDMSQVSDWLKKIDELYAKGKISPAEYAAAVKDLSGKFKDLGIDINRVLPPAHDMNKAWDEMRPKIGELPRVLEDVGYGFDDARSALVYWSRQLDVGTDKIATAILAWQNLQFTLLGFGPILGGINFDPLVEHAKVAKEQVYNPFKDLMRDMREGFARTFDEWLSGAMTFSGFLKGVWGDIKTSFFKVIGDMVAEWTVKLIQRMITDMGGLVKDIGKFFSSLFSSVSDGVAAAAKTAADAAGNAAKAVGDVTSAAAGAISGVWMALGSAVGSFLGTLLGNILSGGPSGHQQQQQINDTKDSRNFLADIKNWFFSAGGGFGGAIYEFSTGHLLEKFDGLKGSMDDTRTSLWSRIGDLIPWLSDISGWGSDISGKLGNLKSAAGGAVITTTELVMVHGTPAAPEYIGTERMLSNVAAMPKAANGGDRSRDVIVNIHLNGQMITDREYTRDRLFPEMIAALKSGLKSEFQAALGVA